MKRENKTRDRYLEKYKSVTASEFLTLIGFPDKMEQIKNILYFKIVIDKKHSVEMIESLTWQVDLKKK